MFKRKKYIRLDQIAGSPKSAELKRLLFESNRARGCTVELPWRSQKTGLRYSVTVCYEEGMEPIWSLYQGEGAQSRMVWTQAFKDPDLLSDVINLSLPAEAALDALAESAKANDRDYNWNPELERSKHTYASSTNEVELLTLPPDTTLPVKPASDEFYTLPPIEAELISEPIATQTSLPELDEVTQAVPADIDEPQDSSQLQSEPPTQLPPEQSSFPIAHDPLLQPHPQGAQQGYAYPPGYPPQYSQGNGYPPVNGPPQYFAPDGTPYQPGYGAQYPPQDPSGYPNYPPPGYPPNYQPGYPGGYPQGYPPPYPPADPGAYQQPYPQPGYPMQYQPGYPMQGGYPAQPGYPMQQFAHAPASGGTIPRVAANSDLIAKRPNILLGDFLVETGLIPETTLEAALQLQEMVRNGALSTTQAAEAVRRAHNRGGEVEQFTPSTPQMETSGAKVNAPPLGEILVEAGLIRINILKAALNLQEVVRTGALSKEEAVEAFIQEHFGKAGKQGTGESSHDQNILELFIKAKLIRQSDLDAAIAVKKKHGGEVSKILEAAGKVDKMTYEAAGKCQSLLEEKRLKIEQAIIALHYCQRSRVSFDDAIDELGWEKP